ncbi:hypothetical protein HPB49_021251 [Dermacentor silvarum]|uniref:Uncharacterized protein n=1 Tax=Dermacentor silvarum TaxID=543639 RepID=A0ACB8CHG0_DERSI|nr:hypothetical protein HPB49_021251 [Dermacentor silvarum]
MAQEKRQKKIEKSSHRRQRSTLPDCDRLFQFLVVLETTAAPGANPAGIVLVASQLPDVFQHHQQRAGTTMETEVQARVGLPVVLVNRDGLYVIIAVLGVSILGCACVLTYSLGNYGKMKKNAEEVRNYILHRDTKAAVKEHSGGKQTTATGGTGPSDARSVTVQIRMPNYSAKGSSVDAGPSLGAGPNNSDYVLRGAERQ